MIDHISIQVADLEASAAFYDAVLETLDGGRLLVVDGAIGYGVERPQFWIGQTDAAGESHELHLAFTAVDRYTVQRFYEAAEAAGAEVLHEPRLWPEYHPHYYGVFVRDPDGNNIEAVCHHPHD